MKEGYDDSFLPIPSAPEKLIGEELELVSASITEAYFRDANKVIWRFDYDKNSFVVAYEADLHPMAWQFYYSIDADKRRFQNKEDAMFFLKAAKMTDELNENIYYYERWLAHPEETLKGDKMIMIHETLPHLYKLRDLLEEARLETDEKHKRELYVLADQLYENLNLRKHDQW